MLDKNQVLQIPNTLVRGQGVCLFVGFLLFFKSYLSGIWRALSAKHIRQGPITLRLTNFIIRLVVNRVKSKDEKATKELQWSN